MPLHVPECAVVRQNVEPVGGTLECPAGTVPAVATIADESTQDRHALINGHGPDPGVHLTIGAVRHRVERSGNQLHLGVRIPVREVHDRCAGDRLLRREVLLGQVLEPLPDVGGVAANLLAPVRKVHPLQE